MAVFGRARDCNHVFFVYTNVICSYVKNHRATKNLTDEVSLLIPIGTYIRRMMCDVYDIPNSTDR